MEKPVVAQKEPYAMEVEPGRYFWCACGLSREQPFCDGSHKGTGINPVKTVIAEKKTVYFCGCKQTGGAPYCDGAHKDL